MNEQTESASQRAEPVARTPQDYAIEHAEYMAKDAEKLVTAVADLALAEAECEDGTANESDVEAARELVNEYMTAMRSGIYEFRKRRDRALKLGDAVQAAEGGWQPIETAPKNKGYLLGLVEGTVRFIQWGKASHVPMYGWCLADQGVEQFDLCAPTHWQQQPAAPSSHPQPQEKSE